MLMLYTAHSKMMIVKCGIAGQVIPWQVPALAATCALEEQQMAAHETAALAKQWMTKRYTANASHRRGVCDYRPGVYWGMSTELATTAKHQTAYIVRVKRPEWRARALLQRKVSRWLISELFASHPIHGLRSRLPSNLMIP